MGVGTLTDRAAGQTILEGFFNDIHSAMKGDFVGRDTASGVPASGKSLGTAAFPWGSIRANSLVLGGSVVDTSKIVSEQNRIISGASRALSNQPLFIDPAGVGGGASFTLLGATTNLVVDINSSEITYSTDVVKSSLALAPSTNNTALVNDSDAADQESTRTWGETISEAEKNFITIDNVGSEISGLVGTLQAFQINDGATDEFFIAEITTSTTLKKVFRGFFSDAAGNPINRIKFANNDVITLMRSHWIFVDTDAASIDTTTRAPTYSFTSPTSPISGDYWFDLNNKLWKRFDGVSFVIINRTLVGLAITDDTDCVAARSFDFDSTEDLFNGIDLEKSTTEIIIANGFNQEASVEGEKIVFRSSKATWNITTDLATSADLYNASEQASTIYYLYLTDEGEEKISDISPYERLEKRGFYHPHNPWRCLGLVNNDGSSDLGDPFNEDAAFRNGEIALAFVSNAGQSIPNTTNTIINYGTKRYNTHPSTVVTGASWAFTCVVRGLYRCQGQAGYNFLAGLVSTCNVDVFRDGVEIRENGGGKQGSSAEAFTPSIEATVILERGQTIDFRTFQNSGGSESLSSATTRIFCEIEKVGKGERL